MKNLVNAVQVAGPLDEKTRALIKLAISTGARLEGAVHSHARKALKVKCTADEIRQVALLSHTYNRTTFDDGRIKLD